MATISELWRKVKPPHNPYEDLDVKTLRFKQRNIRNTIALYEGHLAIYNAKSYLSDEEYCRKSELERGIEMEKYQLKLCTKALVRKEQKALQPCKECLRQVLYKIVIVYAILAAVVSIISCLINIIF